MTPTNWPRRALITTAAVLALVPTLAAAPAHAEPPPNDGIAGAIPVELESTTTFDSTEATEDSKPRPCVHDQSVWFRFTANEDRLLRVTTAGSDFGTRLGIFEGPRRHLDLIRCNDDDGPGDTSAARFDITEGQRYWVAVSTARDDESGGPGMLTIGRSRTQADVVIDSTRSGGASGRLFVSGTVTCSSAAEVWISAEASQRVGDNVAQGHGGANGRLCGEEPTEFNLRIDSYTGWAFQPGPVAITVRSYVWNGLLVARRATTTTVTAVDDPDARPVP